MISVIAFLGNVGRQYAGNRHNVAWQFADTLSILSGTPWQKKFRGQYAALPVTGADGSRRLVHCIKPETFMNLSGESIAEAASFFKVKPEEILVVHDELELPVGTASLKWSGGLGGHNGLRSAKASLGTADFWRLRFGIGRPDHPDVAGYVLSDFTSDERITLSLVWPPVGELLAGIIEKGPEAFQKEWQKKKLTQ